MKKSILMIALVMVFGLFCSTSLWAGNGTGARDGSRLNAVSVDPIEGVVMDAGIAGSGLIVDDYILGSTTVYGMGPISYWDSIGVAKPTVGEEVLIEAVLVTSSDGTITRLVAVSVTIAGEPTVDLRDENGVPLWRGLSDGTGICPLVTE